MIYSQVSNSLLYVALLTGLLLHLGLSLDLFFPLPLDFVPLCLLLILCKGGWGLGASITPVQVIEKV